MNRRDFLRMSGIIGGGLLFGLNIPGCKSKTEKAPLTLTPLPYAEDSLEPYLSTQTLYIHYGKHHNGYIAKTQKLITDTSLESLSLSQIIQKTYNEKRHQDLFNNAAQCFNHDFFWKSMQQNGGGKPEGEIGKQIEASFGSYDDFKKRFFEESLSLFGSGWIWLVKESRELKIVKTGNADSPIARGITPLLTLDLWEHAYYLDYQNRRGEYIKAFLDHLVNWQFAEKNLG